MSYSMWLAATKVIYQRCHVVAGQTANCICAGAANWAGVCSLVVAIGGTADTLDQMSFWTILRRKWFACLPRQEGGWIPHKEAKTKANYLSLTWADAKGSSN